MEEGIVIREIHIHNKDQSSNRRFRTAACQIFTNISNENAVAI